MKAKTPTDADQKLNKIVNEIVDEAKKEYYKYAKICEDPISEKEFDNELSLYLKYAFIPPLDDHPIRDVSEEKIGKTCPRCGAKMPLEAAYCGKCGAKL